ncbi:MAG: N-acetylmuramoyl-L-alanine amidase [Advenella sp.]|uniref:N-acetylmuramoyl-L-alanine amidase n=1 Tax=Advenella sp. TaxID=1872388 RepID=UPI00258573CB|nr:N-acetylmuramoyl-L-alanine amidase [Advenella sp.]MDD3757235.1 N-acetylmuramoyl-L-alanine amidase [Advenella sp.]
MLQADFLRFAVRWFQRLSGVFGLSVLLACSQQEYAVDESFTAAAQDSRVRFIVLHYTSENNADSLRILTQNKVSAHYLLTAGKNPVLYRLVDENRRAWHAGISQWYGYKNLNAMSIGIEVVNLGPLNEQKTQWDAYSPEQIDLLVALLRDLAQRHQVRAKHIVGHSDIAPQRKIDPGPLFPWQALARQGIGRWYDEDRVRQYEARFAVDGVPDWPWFQEKLRRIGYEVEFGPGAQVSTRRVLQAFQMHYRPQRYDGQPDIRTAAILMDLAAQEDG